MKKGLVSVYDLNDPVTPAVFEEANEPVKVQVNWKNKKQSLREHQWEALHRKKSTWLTIVD